MDVKEVLDKATSFEHREFRVLKIKENNEHSSYWIVGHSYTLNYTLREDGEFNANVFEHGNYVEGNRPKRFSSPDEAFAAIDLYRDKLNQSLALE